MYSKRFAIIALLSLSLAFSAFAQREGKMSRSVSKKKKGKADVEAVYEEIPPPAEPVRPVRPVRPAAVIQPAVVDTAAIAQPPAAVDTAIVARPADVDTAAIAPSAITDTAVAVQHAIVDTIAVIPTVAIDTTSAIQPIAADTAAVIPPVIADTATAIQPIAADTAAVIPPVTADTADTAVAIPPAPVSPPPVKKIAKAPPPPPSHQQKRYPISVPDIEMIYVKGGKFRMGCPMEDQACVADERPVHEVKINDFLIGKYPVTQKQWKSVTGANPSNFDGDDLPVEQVSWDDIQVFLEKLNAMTGKRYRLLTEAEWEYAARGGAGGKATKSSGRGFADDVARRDHNSAGKTLPVGKREPNEIGVHDIGGNVWEWVEDRYDRYYYRDSPVKNPKGPRHGAERVYRGSSFNSFEYHGRVTLRNKNKPEHRAIDLGFRLALTP
jgi:formylglycine-generating enzyme required for sulfatase activity